MKQKTQVLLSQLQIVECGETRQTAGNASLQVPHDPTKDNSGLLHVGSFFVVLAVTEPL